MLGVGVPDEMLGGVSIPSAMGGIGMLSMMGGSGVLRCISEHAPCPQDPLERERALQLQIAEAARRLCREENIGRQVRKRRQTAALREEQKLRDLEQVLSQRRLLAGQRDMSTAKGEPPEPHGGGGCWRAGRQNGVLLGWVSLGNASKLPIPCECTPLDAAQSFIPSACTPLDACPSAIPLCVPSHYPIHNAAPQFPRCTPNSHSW